MPYAKDTKPYHYIFAISDSFQQDWGRFCKQADRQEKPISEHLRNVIKKHNCDLYGKDWEFKPPGRHYTQTRESEHLRNVIKNNGDSS